jgi:hypothetical protein
MPIVTTKEDIQERINGSGNLLNRLNIVQSPSSSNIPPPKSIQEEKRDEVPKDFGPVKLNGRKRVSSFNLYQEEKRISNKIDDDTRLILATLGKLIGSTNVARATGISKSVIHYLSNGERHTTKQTNEGRKEIIVPDDDLRERMKILMPKIQDTAIDRFYKAAGFLTEAEMAAVPIKVRAITMSQIMSNMMSVVQKSMPRDNGSNININNEAQVVVMTPETKKVEDYEVVEGNVIK